jgi:hypothetical protein
MSIPLDHRLPDVVLRPDVTLPEAALAYTRAGFPVLPLRGKLPLVPHGVDDATVDPLIVEHWWKHWPQANIGIPTGPPSGLIVLDIDPRHGGLDSFAHLQRALHHRAADLHAPPVFLLATLIQRTGGAGLHLMFGWRDALDLGNAVGFAGYPGLDMRGKRGYIVCSPSRHASGGRYSWLNPGPPQPFPDLLVDLLRVRKQLLATPRFSWVSPAVQQTIASRRSDPAYWLNFVLARVMIGNRHEKALFLAYRLLQEARLSPAQAEGWMQDYARRVPQGEGEDYYPVEDALNCLKYAASRSISS